MMHFPRASHPLVNAQTRPSGACTCTVRKADTLAKNGRCGTCGGVLHSADRDGKVTVHYPNG